MATLLSFCARSACNISASLQCSGNVGQLLSARVLANIQMREMTKWKTRTNRPAKWWTIKRVKFCESYLTPDNKEFIQDVVQEKYPDPLATNSPLKEPPWPRGEWQPRSFRTGVISRKIGIYPMWKKDGTRLLTTVLQVLDNNVIRYIPPEEYSKFPHAKQFKGKYGSLVVGADAGDPQLFTKEYCGMFERAGVMPKRKLTRFLVTPNAAIQPGTALTAMHFRVGDYVDCFGITVEHGFQGVMKRWGMSGGPASHGCTKAHRRVGSIGSGRKMARVWPGKRMPGHMGSEKRILKGLRIWRINTKYNVIWVHGPAVPGAVNTYVYIMDTVLPNKKPQTPPPFPTYFPDDQKEELPENLYDPELHAFTDPTILFEDEPEIVIPTTSTKKIAKTASKSK